MTTLNLDNVDLGGFGVTDVEKDDSGFTGDEYSLDSHTSSTVGEAFKTDAEQHSKVKQLSRESGIPAEAVAGDPAAVETNLKLKNIDFSDMSRRTPGTALFLTDFDNAVIAQNDISIMQRVEDTLRSIPGGLVSGFGAGFEGTGRAVEAGGRLATRGVSSILPESFTPYLYQTEETPELLKEINELLDIGQLFRSAGAGMKESGEAIADVPAERQNLATDIGAGLGQVSGQIVTSLMSAPLGMGMMFGQGVDQQGERQEESGTEGRDTTSDLGLFASGGATLFTEKMGLDALMNRIPPKIKNDVLRQVTDIGIAGGIEAVQEVVEGIAQGLIEQFTTNPDAEIFEGLDREAMAAGGVGAIMRAIINAVVPGRMRTAREVEEQHITQGQAEQVTLDKLNTDISSMKMKQYDTETLRKFVEEINTNDQHIFIDSTQASLYLKDKTADEIAAEPALQLMVNSLVEATVTGTDVEVSLEDFAIDIVGTQTYDDLREHMTMNPESVTPFRAEAAREEVNNYIQTMVEEANQDISQYAEAQEIYETVQQQLVDSGQVTPQNSKVMAEVVPAWAAVYAKKNGISITEAFEKSGLNITGPQTGERARLEGELELLDQNSLEELLAEFDDLFPEGSFPKEVRQSIMDAPVQERQQRLLESTGLDKDAAWTDERLDAVIDENTGEYRVAFVNPADFVNATHPDPQVIADESGELDLDKLQAEGQTPFIWVDGDGEIVGHEGRHRMAALVKAGVKRVPIKLRFIGGTDSIDTKDESRSYNLKGQQYDTGSGVDLKIPESILALPENRNLIKESMGDADVMFQPSTLPDRFAIIDAVKGRTPIEDVITQASSLVGTVEGVYSVDNMGDLNEDNQKAIQGIEDVAVIQSDFPEVIAYVWDKSGKVYEVINGNVEEMSTEQDPNSDLTPSQGYTLNAFSELFHTARNTDPAEIEAQRVRDLRTKETRRRQERLKDIPAMPADFDQALQELADWSENFEEFQKALNPDMFDISDRNLTRLGRATMSLDPEFETAGDEGTVTIYRALPEGENIEAGDWVSFDEQYAAGHESNVGEEGGTTVSIEVPADEVYTPGADENEWVYIPKNTWGDIESIEELWQSLTDGSKPDTYPEVEGGQLFAQSAVELTEDEQMLADELIDNGAEVIGNTVKVYHRTNSESAVTINNTGKMKGDEDGLFFTTKLDGQAEGFGDSVIELNVPLSELQLDDAFGDEAHLRLPTKKAGDYVDVSQWITKPESETFAQSAVEGEKYQTGTPVDLFFTKNTESAPAPGGMDFGQDLEPAGDYLVVGESDFSGNQTPGWLYGTVSFKNPLVLEHKSTNSTGWKKDLSEMFDGKTGKQLTAAIKKAGYDGILTTEEYRGNIELNEAVNISGDRIEGATSLPESETFAQDQLSARDQVQPDKNLFVAHNITAEGILAANELGGLAAPSIAVARADISDFEGFGEITLLADPELLNDPKARTFDADVYTPRQPRATYNVNGKKYSSWREGIKAETEGLNLNIPPIGQLGEESGADGMVRSDAVKYKWLADQGKAPKLKKRKVPTTVKQGAKIEGHEFQLRDDPKMIKLAEKHYRAKVDQAKEADPVRGERYEEVYFDDGVLNPNHLLSFIAETRKYAASDKDLGLLRHDISAKFRNEKLRKQFEQDVTSDFNNMVDGKTLFKGFTDAGNRKYVEYNMANVLREMTQSLQGGETSFYGAPSVRSAHANEMKTIAQVQARRDQIIPEDDLAVIKEDANSIFENALEDLKPFYKFDADSWGYAEDVGTAIMQGGKELRETINLTPESKKIIDDLTEYLSALPSTYFESKVQRAVGFNEFNTAVVPRGMDKAALQVLKDAGLKVKTYNPKEEGSRAEVIAKQNKLLFQKGARGYYDPSNSMIRLTEASDLSTFLHEFAHFMYEMELKAGGDTMQSIHNWFKRNADDVAKEANGYYDASVQGDLEQSPELPGFEAGAITPDDVTAYLDNKTTGDTEKDKAIRRAVHEQFARGFETYLMEGKAPSTELRNAFRTFARWLTQIYKSIRGQLNVNIDDEMRQVFDRMLATEEQIEAANARSKYSPMFKDATSAEMSEEEFKAYNDKVEKTKDVETETLRDKLIKEITRTATNQWKEEKQDIIDEQLDILKKERVYRAIETLKAPKTTDSEAEAKIKKISKDIEGLEKQIVKLQKTNDTVGKFIAKNGGLNREAMAAEGVDPSNFKQRGKVFGKVLFPKTGGMTTDQVAELLNEEGFNGGELTANDALDIIEDMLADDNTFVNPDVDVQIENLDRQIQDLSIERDDTERSVMTANIKMDHATVKEMFGETNTDKRGITSTRIPPKLNGMTAKGQEGIHPDDAAALLGYSSGGEMINDILNTDPIRKVASDNAETIMLERHGDILNDGTIEKEADDAVHNEERGELILAELKALRRGTNQPALERAAMKTFAEESIAKLTYRTIFPAKYRKAEIKAAQEAAAALATGDKVGAANAKARQALNYYLGNAATEAKAKTDKIVARMARYNKKKVREEIQKADGGHWDQITKILNRFEFRKTASLKSVDVRNVPITEWMNERIEVEGEALVITNEVLNETYQTHWKNVPYETLIGIDDSVKNIEHVARYANKINTMGEQVEFKKFVNQWTDHMNEVQPDRFKSQRTDVVEGRKFGRWAMAQMTKIPFMASWLDGGERVGMSHDALVQPFTDAYDTEVNLWAEVGKPVMELIEGRDKETIKRHNKKIFIPEIKDRNNDGNLYGHQVLAVALNTGNAENMRKMLLGEGWADPEVDTDISFQNPQLQAVLKHMTKEDWELVQQIWDRMDTLYPALAEVHRKTTGLVPPKVEAQPVVTEFGTFNGGYYPVKYDPNRSNRAQENEDKLNAQTESMFSGSLSIQASVTASATSERTGYYGPIRLSLDVVPNHFQETIHFITHHDAVRQVNKLIRNDKVTNVIKAKLGPEEYAQLKPWLNDIAKDGREAPAKMYWDKMLQKLRFGVTLGAMGFKASTGIIQISGLSNTFGEVGVKPTLQALRSILASENSIKSAWEFASENSKVMNHRVNTMDREIKNAMSKIEGKRGVLAAAQEMSMKHIALIQTYMVDLPTWHAAYIKSMTEHGDEARAYKYADWTVESVQGSGITKDMAQIMRGQSETGRMFTMFMTFFSSLWNLERDLVKGAKSGRYSVTTTGAKMMFFFTLPVLFEMIMRGEFGDEDDEPEDVAQKTLLKVALFPVQSVPFVRDIANGVSGDFGYNMSPLASVLEQGTQAIPKLLQNSFTGEEVTYSQVKGSVKFAGAAAGIPGIGQAFATGEHIYDVIEEGEELTLHQLLFGPKKD